MPDKIKFPPLIIKKVGPTTNGDGNEAVTIVAKRGDRIVGRLAAHADDAATMRALVRAFPRAPVTA